MKNKEKRKKGLEEPAVVLPQPRAKALEAAQPLGPEEEHGAEDEGMEQEDTIVTFMYILNELFQL